MSEWDDFRQDQRIVRVIHASVDETVEIHWRRRAYHPIKRTAGMPDIIDETLVERHSAPPVTVWDARKEKIGD